MLKGFKHDQQTKSHGFEQKKGRISSSLNKKLDDSLLPREVCNPWMDIDGNIYSHSSSWNYVFWRRIDTESKPRKSQKVKKVLFIHTLKCYASKLSNLLNPLEMLNNPPFMQLEK